jgi:DHA2 family methylenomycin A resistance protein-like MFS transporter
VAAAVAFLVAVAALIAFARTEAGRGAAAMVPLPMFAIPAFRGAVTATAGMTFGMYGALFLLPLVWLTEKTLGPIAAGVALTPSALVFVATSPFSGRLAERVGARLMMSGGVAIIGSGLILIGATASEPGLAGAEFGLALTGLGMGLATGPLMGTAVGAVFALVGGGAGGLRLAMLLGGALQVAAALSAWTTTRVEARASSGGGAL